MFYQRKQHADEADENMPDALLIRTPPRFLLLSQSGFTCNVNTCQMSTERECVFKKKRTHL